MTTAIFTFGVAKLLIPSLAHYKLGMMLESKLALDIA